MIYDNAMKFLSAGIGIIPVTYRDKRPAMCLLPELDGHTTWEPYKTKLPTPQEVDLWFRQPVNYGVICGWQNLTVLDFDDMPEYINWQLWATRAGGVAEFVATHAYRVTSNRGMHVYIRLPHKERNRKAGKIDIKGDGYVLGPGSIHPSGAEYQAQREALLFPVIEALSDVLPTALLIPSVTPPGATVWQTPPRPWAATGHNLIAKIKAAYPIESLFPQAKPSGKGWLLATCPFHDDHHPSLWINTEQGICGCFSGCTDKPLDVINVYARMNGLSNRDAIGILMEKL